MSTASVCIGTPIECFMDYTKQNLLLVGGIIGLGVAIVVILTSSTMNPFRVSNAVNIAAFTVTCLGFVLLIVKFVLGYLYPKTKIL